MTPRNLVVLFVAAVVAAVAGWFAGATARDLVAGGYETAVGTVEVRPGVPVSTPSPSPEPTEEATEEPTPPPTEEPTQAPSPSPSPTPTLTPEFTEVPTATP